MPARSKRLTGCLVAILLSVAILGGLVAVIYAFAWSRVDGTISLRGGGDVVEFTPDLCASGDAFVPGFLGVVFRHSERPGYVLVVEAPDAVRFEAPGAVEYVPPSACSRRVIRVGWAQAEVNDISAVEGHVELSCALELGALDVTLDFEACHRSVGW